MRLFFNQQLEEHLHWSDMVASDLKTSTETLDELSWVADSVFLWLFLINRSLRDDLKVGDTVRHLWISVRQVSRGLEAYSTRAIRGTAVQKRFLSSIPTKCIIHTPDSHPMGPHSSICII